MAVPLTIPQAARAHFQSGMEHVAQQTQSRFRDLAVVKTGCKQKSEAHRKLPRFEMSNTIGRLQPTNGQELSLMQRYLFPQRAEGATIIDEDDADELALSVAPTGDIVTQHRMAAARKIDSIFLSGITGKNYEGLENEEGMTAVTLEGAYGGRQVIPVNAVASGTPVNSGLTLYKLVKAKARFAKLEVYGQRQKAEGAKLCMAVSQDELDNLLLDVEKTGNADYNKVKALVDGEVDYFMGIEFFRSELIPYGPPVGDFIIRDCPMWVSNQVHLDFWYDIKTSIDVLPTRSQAIQVYSRIKVGACRADENAVVLVRCEQKGYLDAA